MSASHAPHHADVAIVGGGLAGLTAANVLADAGRSVIVLESRSDLGGRATTDTREGLRLNQGPRALYLDGIGLETLRTIDIDPAGGVPSTKGASAVIDGHVGLLPGSAGTLARTSLLSAGAKIETGRFMASLPKIDPGGLAGQTSESWLRSALHRDDARDLVRGLMRVATYVADLEGLSADIGVRQLQLAFGGVRYVDGGWMSIVDLLRRRAEDRGVRVMERARVRSVVPDGGRWAVHGTDVIVTAGAVLVAGLGPDAAARITESRDLAAFAASARSVDASVLDVGLTSLPVPGRRFAYGIDQPFYFSVHNPPADLGDGVVLHVMKYLSEHDHADAGSLRSQLSEFLDTVQPGWQDHLVTERFLRRMTVVHATPTPATGGRHGRFPLAVADRPGVFVAGDWVGSEGHLADAAIASAAAAARAMAEQLVAA